MTPHDLIAAFDVLADAPDGVKRLREQVLSRAVRGKLVVNHPGADPNRVVGGGLVPGKNGLITTEFSGSYGKNWTPAVREQFQDFLTSRGVNLQHQPYKDPTP